MPARLKHSLFLTFILFLLPATALCEELEMINRPVNTSGLTGLLFTNSPFTVPDGSIEIGVAAISEQSTVPEYSINEIPLITATFGMSKSSEIALKGSYFRRSTDGDNKKERGAGDTELSYKRNFHPQTESSSMPAASIIITGIAPTSNREANLGGVAHWGAKIGLSIGKEILWGDHVTGVYADAIMVVQDLSDERIRDRYGIYNAGLLFPISKYRNLQMLIEYRMVSGVDRITIEGGDYSALTYGLRLVGERFNLTFGTQFLDKKTQELDDSSKIIGMMSLKM